MSSIAYRHRPLSFCPAFLESRNTVPTRSNSAPSKTLRSESGSVTARNLIGFKICQAEPSMTSNLQSIAALEGTEVTIVGQGRIGTALAEMSPYPTKPVRRGEVIDGASSGPIIVCTRNDTLDGIVEATPEHRRSDLVFLQNGMLLPWLETKGLEDNTQALIYFGVAKLGEAPIDGITEVDPNGLTTVYGKHAEVLNSIIKAGGLACHIVNKEEFLRGMLEKLIWISAVMLVGTEHRVNVGEVDNSHSEEVSDLMRELAKSGEAALNVSVSPNMVEKLLAYSRAVASYPCAVKEFQWRNGWFHGLSTKALEKGQNDPSPMHTALLKKVGAI